eukprot:PhF_6_TR41966/c0_g1_i1/m.63485
MSLVTCHYDDGTSHTTKLSEYFHRHPTALQPQPPTPPLPLKPSLTSEDDNLTTTSTNDPYVRHAVLGASSEGRACDRFAPAVCVAPPQTILHSPLCSAAHASFLRGLCIHHRSHGLVSSDVLKLTEDRGVTVRQTPLHGIPWNVENVHPLNVDVHDRTVSLKKTSNAYVARLEKN